MFVVDRIEGNIVVLEYEDVTINVPLSYFKEEIVEGDILYLKVDKEETEKRKEMTKEKLIKLFNKHKN